LEGQSYLNFNYSTLGEGIIRNSKYRERSHNQSYTTDSSSNNQVLRKSHYDEERSNMIDLIRKLEIANEENLNLRLRLDEMEVIKNQMAEDLNELENEINISSRRFMNREMDLNDKINLLENERRQLQERLNYHINSNDTQMRNSVSTDEMLIRENRRLKQELTNREDKLESLTLFFNKMQNVLPNKILNDGGFVLLERLEPEKLKKKLDSMVQEVERLSLHQPEIDHYSKNSQEKILTQRKLENRGQTPGESRGPSSFDDRGPTPKVGNSDDVSQKLKNLTEENELIRKKIETMTQNRILSHREIGKNIEEKDIGKNKKAKSGYSQTPQKNSKTQANADLIKIEDSPENKEEKEHGKNKF
jgi:hypothetical protein